MLEFLFYVTGTIAFVIYIADNWQQLKNLFNTHVRN